MTTTISKYAGNRNRVALTMLVGGAFVLLVPAPALSIDLHVVTNFQARSAATSAQPWAAAPYGEPPPPPPMPGPDDGSGGGLDPHRVTGFEANLGGSMDISGLPSFLDDPDAPPPMPGPDDGSGGGLDPHRITYFQANLGGSMGISGLPSFLDDPDDAPPPLPSEWDWLPLFEPGSVVPDGGGGTFGVPSWPNPAPPPDGSNFGDAYPVPEPATLALLALGGLAILRRRR